MCADAAVGAVRLSDVARAAGRGGRGILLPPRSKAAGASPTRPPLSSSGPAMRWRGCPPAQQTGCEGRGGGLRGRGAEPSLLIPANGRHDCRGGEGAGTVGQPSDASPEGAAAAGGWGYALVPLAVFGSRTVGKVSEGASPTWTGHRRDVTNPTS